MKKSFSKKTIKKLQNYVYAYIDKSTEEILYVGRGVGNRAFAHIPKYNELGKNVKIDILRHGLSTNQAKRIESTLIDSLGFENLDNKVKGNKSNIFGRVSVEDIDKRFGSGEIFLDNFKHHVICFFPHKALAEGHNYYDACRQFWSISHERVFEKNGNKFKYEYALLCMGNFVEEVYKIIDWFPAGTTHSSRNFNVEKKDDLKRLEFIGQIADKKIRNFYRHKSIMHEKNKPVKPIERGFRYF